MNQSFAATIAFGLLTLAMVFLVNLFGMLSTGSEWHAWGAVAAILASGAAYLAQMMFTTAYQWALAVQQAEQPGFAGPSNPDAWDNYRAAEFRGTVLQWASIAIALGALLAFGQGIWS